VSLLTVILIACGLSLDAFAVSIASGIVIRRERIRHALKVALFFGGFQALMPTVGWLAGLGLRNFISGIDHWIAFGLLVFIGSKMIVESRCLEKMEEKGCPTDNPTLLMLAIATSIDALAVGLSFSLLQVSIVLPVAVIGAITFAVSFGGFLAGSRFGHCFEKKIEVAGGLILIGIGLKILIEHLLT
jgi:putative Mn2+ efflux pump MntP